MLVCHVLQDPTASLETLLKALPDGSAPKATYVKGDKVEVIAGDLTSLTGVHVWAELLRLMFAEPLTVLHGFVLLPLGFPGFCPITHVVVFITRCLSPPLATHGPLCCAVLYCTLLLNTYCSCAAGGRIALAGTDDGTLDCLPPAPQVLLRTLVLMRARCWCVQT